jgi:hypothetical protein
MKKYIVEAVEGKLAVLLPRNDESERVVVRADRLPAEIKDGDIIEAEVSNEGEVTEYNLLTGETKEAFDRNQAMLDRIRKKQK